MDVLSVHKFLCLCDQYIAKVKKRAIQLLLAGTVPREAVFPINHKFCIDADLLELTIEPGLIKDVSSLKLLTLDDLRLFLDEKAKEGKDTVDLSSPDAIVKSELRMNMSDQNAPLCMESLFIYYCTMLHRNGLV